MKLPERIDDRIRAWRITVERTSESERSFLVFGRRDRQPIVLKVVKSPGDEWRTGEILNAFGGKGVVRIIDHVEGAVLLEHLSPGLPLSTRALGGADEEATTILMDVIRRMSPRTPMVAVPAVADWGRGFDRYAASGDARIPKVLLAEASRVYSELCDSQRAVRLLHGDLHHYNVLLDERRGWVAIDPKGVVGELEYEVGAALRNPWENPGLFAEPSVIRERVDLFRRGLGLSSTRILSWGFAQAVLSVIWAIEDGLGAGQTYGSMTLANALRTMLRES